MSSIGYLGPVGTHTHQSLLQFLGGNQYSNLHAFDSVHALFQALKSTQVDSIFIPIENSVGGEVVSSLDCLLDMQDGFWIQADYSKVIEQTLMAVQKYENLSDITDIFAHEQSIHQSRFFLEKHCPNAVFHYCSSNAQAANIVAQNEFEFLDDKTHHLACIGSQICTSRF